MAEMIRKGKTALEVVAARPAADFDSKVDQAGITAERFINPLQAELGGE